MSTIQLDIPPVATVSAIEQAFYDLFNANDKDSYTEIELNFKGVRFIEPSTSTSYLIAMLYTCHEKGYDFKIIPPNDNGIKIILYTWRFFEVLEETTSVPIYKFAPELKRDFEQGIDVRLSRTINKTLKYYQNVDTSNIKDYFKKRYLGRDSIYFLTTNEKFFPLLTLNFSTPELKEKEFINEKERWKNTVLINRVLNNNLDNIEIKDEISEDVISETISNAIIHSNASQFFTGSFFNFSDEQSDEQPKKDKNSYFTINFWDNGSSIIDTLKLPLREGKKIKSTISEKHYQSVTKNTNQIEFLIKMKDHYIEDFFTTNSELRADLDEEHILLAAFFPGVSREPDREPDLFNPYHPGIGLSYLTNTVMNKLKGKISVRTKKYFLNIKCLSNYEKKQYIKEFKNSKENKFEGKDFFNDNSTYYKAKFKEYNNKMPEFKGNMITIMIPLKQRYQNEIN
jgi:hypothetical protein